jgi:nitrite reductase/ring-hydroxylating ferredoxin subunit
MVTTTRKTEIVTPTPLFEEKGFHQTWYPICLATEIDNQNVVGVEFLGSKVVAYRDTEGKPVVQTAYCRHLGADLSIGKIVDGQIQCRFHLWQYDNTGACSKIPTGDKIPPGARLFTYPAAEAWGLIWAFNGEEPLFELPAFPGVAEKDILYTVLPIEGFPVDPFILLTNAFDIQHLRSVHGLILEDPKEVVQDEYGFDYDTTFEMPGMGQFEQHIRVVGTNTTLLSGTMAGSPVFSMWSGRATKSGETVGFLVSGTLKLPSQDEATLEQSQAIIQTNLGFQINLIEDDRPIMTTIRFREGFMSASDRFISRFLKYVRQFPKADPAQDYR